MQRLFTSILTGDVQAAARFYEALLGFERHFDSDWFVILVPPGNPGPELGLLQRDHAIVPAEAQAAPAGVLLTFVLDDIAGLDIRAEALGGRVVKPSEDMPYGQRRLLIRDLDGTLVDLSAPLARRPS
ncbi:MAG: VOC family protein [Pseudomonadota bacterium]